MFQFSSNKRPRASLIALSLVVISCASISKFDQYAYTQATSLKVDALSVMQNANESYSQHHQDVQAVRTSLDKMYEYERNRPKNAVTEKMWALLTDTSGHLYGGFIKRWQKEDKLDTAFIRISKDLVGQSFDQISQLESGKIKP